MAWGLSYSQFFSVCCSSVLDEHDRLAPLPLPDDELERGNFLALRAHVREQRDAVVCLMAHHKLDRAELTAAQVYWMVRIGANDLAKPSAQLERAFKQVDVSADGSCFVFKGDSAPIKHWVMRGPIVEYHVRYNGAGPQGVSLGVDMELSVGMCVPAVSTSGPSANTSAVGTAQRRF